MTAGLFARVAITHIESLVENPVSANAASVPTAAVRFWTKLAPSFSFSDDRPLANFGSDLVICAVSSSNIRKGSRIET